jgi:hypothetical protein
MHEECCVFGRAALVGHVSDVCLMLYVCPHPTSGTIYLASSHCYVYVSSSYYICRVLLLLYMCPHPTIYLVPSYCYICVLIFQSIYLSEQAFRVWGARGHALSEVGGVGGDLGFF